MRGWSCGGQKSHANQGKICEVFALKFASIPLSTKLFGVIYRSCK